MLSYLQDLGDALLKPRELMAITRVENRSLASPMITVMVTASGIVGAFWTPIHSIIASVTGASLGSAISALIIVGSGFLGIVGWVVLGSLLHALSRLLGGEGSLEDTLRAFGYSVVGFWVTVPPTLIFSVSGIASGMLGFIVGVILGLLWHLYSLILALSEAHGFSTLRAFLAIILSALVPAVLILVVLALV